MFLKSEYAKEYCVKDVKFVQLPPGWWPKYIEQHAVDIAWGGGPTQLDLLFKLNLLRPLQTRMALEAAAQIPDTLAGSPMKRVHDGKIYWVANALASFGFTVNTEIAQQLGFDWRQLRSWRDLASDQLGLLMLQVGVPVVGIADPTVSTSNTRMYEIMLQAYGWEEGWRTLTLLGANSRIYSGSSLVRDAVVNGEIMVGITIDFYGYTAHRENPACVYVLPQGETIVNADPIAVTVSTKNPEAAEAFVAWSLTDGQAIWLDPNINRLPANPKIFETPIGRMRQDLYEAYKQLLNARSMKFNDTLALAYEDAMRLYFKATIVDLHDLLQQAWTELLSAYYVEHRIDEAAFRELKSLLTSLPPFKDPLTGRETRFTVEYAIKANKEILQNPQLMDAFMNAWRSAAREKYLEVLRALG
ncbi:MAG: ABC transporter substrate-binding protein [Crenarchaeota archaeon]|nr:ABC transporter substrate-binding protein [Thermoproteota archaeon]